MSTEKPYYLTDDEIFALMEESKRDGEHLRHLMAMREATHHAHETGSRQARLEVARLMMAAGEPIEKICLYTGVPKQDLATLGHLATAIEHLAAAVEHLASRSPQQVTETQNIYDHGAATMQGDVHLGS